MTPTLLFLLAAATPAADPPLHVTTATADKGDVPGGPPLLHTFTLTHPGTAGTVVVTGAEAGCGCLRQKLSSRVLRPGDSTEFTVEVNTLTQPDGPIAWNVRVKYQFEPESGPAVPGTLDLAVVAKVKREVSVSPAQLAFSTAAASEQVLTVTDHRSGKRLTVLKAATANPNLTATIGPAAERDGVHTQPVTLALAAAAPAGQTDETVVLTTDDPVYSEVRVPVRVVKKIHGAVSAFPDSLALKAAKGQAELSGLVQLRADGKPVAVAKVECATAGVAVKASTGTGAVQTVRVTVTPAAAGKAGTATATVTFTEPAGHVLTIPVKWGD
jgi:Protein of unknown function (DUF1573)